MKNKLLLFFFFVVLILSSCLTLPTTDTSTAKRRGGEYKPDGINNSIVYGNIDINDESMIHKTLIKQEDNRYFIVTIVPWESDVVPGVAISGGSGLTYKVNNISEPEILDYEYPSKDGYFGIRNLKPGYYYVGIMRYKHSDDTTYYFKFPKPESIEQCIKVEANSISYWDSIKIIKKPGINNFEFVKNDALNKEDITSILAMKYQNTEWKDIIQAAR